MAVSYQARGKIGGLMTSAKGGKAIAQQRGQASYQARREKIRLQLLASGNPCPAERDIDAAVRAQMAQLNLKKANKRIIAIASPPTVCMYCQPKRRGASSIICAECQKARPHLQSKRALITQTG